MKSMQIIRKHWKLSAALAGVLTVALGLGIAVSLGVFSEEPETTPVVVASTPTQTTTTPKPPPEPTKAPEEKKPEEEPAPTQPGIEWVNYMPYSPVWNPPDQGEAFWQVVDPDKGYPEQGGTRYVLAHACESRTCAGDEVINLQVGETFNYLGEQYRVDDEYQIMKTDIAAQPIWQHVPGKLVMVTCIIEGDWRLSDQNNIVIASPVS